MSLIEQIIQSNQNHLRNVVNIISNQEIIKNNINHDIGISFVIILSITTTLLGLWIYKRSKQQHYTGVKQ